MKLLSIAMAAAIVAISVPTVMTSTASAYQCSNATTQIRAAAPRKWKARARVVKAWSAKVKADRGLAWSVWKIAKQKSRTCKKIGSRWVCLAKAKPCKYVVQ